MKEEIEDRIVNLILYQAPKDWSEYWLNSMMTHIFQEHAKLKGTGEVVPFFNELAHYALGNIATDDGQIPLDQIVNLVEEMLSEIEKSIWDKAYKRLCKRHGEPKLDI